MTWGDGNSEYRIGIIRREHLTLLFEQEKVKTKRKVEPQRLNGSWLEYHVLKI